MKKKGHFKKLAMMGIAGSMLVNSHSEAVENSMKSTNDQKKSGMMDMSNGDELCGAPPPPPPKLNRSPKAPKQDLQNSRYQGYSAMGMDDDNQNSDQNQGRNTNMQQNMSQNKKPLGYNQNNRSQNYNAMGMDDDNQNSDQNQGRNTNMQQNMSQNKKPISEHHMHRPHFDQ